MPSIITCKQKLKKSPKLSENRAVPLGVRPAAGARVYAVAPASQQSTQNENITFNIKFLYSQFVIIIR
jgi:hypothetical protein